MPATSVVETSLADWIRLVRSEFAEMPGLVLTCPQVQRMWGIDCDTCHRVMRQLVADGVVECRSNGTYARPTDLTIWSD